MTSRSRTALRRILRIQAVGLAIALPIGAFNAISVVLDHVRARSGVPLWEPVTWELTSGIAFGLLLPAVVELTRRLPFRRDRWLAVLALHLPAAVLFSLAHVALMVAQRKLAYAAVGRSYELGELRFELPYELTKDVVTFWIVLGLVYGWRFFQRTRRAELDALVLRSELADARLDALRHRLQPHFLFNALNTISATMHRDPAAADTMMARLSDLLRASLEPAGEGEIALARELDLLDAYLAVERARFGDRLQVRIASDPALHDHPVPPLVLQPLVENAIRHGIGKRAGPGRIDVEVTAVPGRLRLEVRDDGPGADRDAELWSGGLGLGGTARRLEALYGAACSIEAGNLAPGGFRVRIEVPLRRGLAGPTRVEGAGEAAGRAARGRKSPEADRARGGTSG